MRDWNVVVTVHEHHFAEAFRYLETLGRPAKTDFYNVLVLQVDDIGQFLKVLHQRLHDEPKLAEHIARVLPVSNIFVFQTHDEFEAMARDTVIAWAHILSGRRFHVRMHRRGFKGRMRSQDEEKFLDHLLMQHLTEQGTAAEIDFDDPDYIIAIETIGQQAGLSLWSRDDLQRYPLVKLD